MRLNLNETVKVKLTERGKEIYRQHFSPLPDGFEQPEPRIDEDGFTKIQLWVFMEMFGEHMSMLKQNVIEPLEIVFDTEEWLYNELEQIAERHHPETPTISEKESVEGDLFNKSLWRMGMHDTNVRPCTMADTSTDTDLISRQAVIDLLLDAQDGSGQAYEAIRELLHEVAYMPPVEKNSDLVNRSDVLELAKSGVLISNDNYKKVCEAINGLPSCHTCRECEPKRPKRTETMMVDGEPTEIDPFEL